jgi:hypothetical protein
MYWIHDWENHTSLLSAGKVESQDFNPCFGVPVIHLHLKDPSHVVLLEMDRNFLKPKLIGNGHIPPVSINL